MSKLDVHPYKNLEQRQVQSALTSQRSKTYGGSSRFYESRKKEASPDRIAAAK